MAQWYKKDGQWFVAAGGGVVGDVYSRHDCDRIFATKTNLKDGLNAKQNTLVAGAGIQIEGDTISAKAPEDVYSKKEADGLFSTKEEVQDARSVADVAKKTADTAKSNSDKNALSIGKKQDKLIAGNNISIEGNTISAIGTDPNDVYSKTDADNTFATKGAVEAVESGLSSLSGKVNQIGVSTQFSEDTRTLEIEVNGQKASTTISGGSGGGSGGEVSINQGPEGIVINGVGLQNASSALNGLLAKEDYARFDAKQPAGDYAEKSEIPDVGGKLDKATFSSKVPTALDGKDGDLWILI